VPIWRALLFLSKERVEKTRFANVMAEFPVLEEQVHGLPQNVVEDLDQFLMKKRIFGSRDHAIRAFDARKSEGHGVAEMGLLKCRPDFGIPFGWTKAHDDVFGTEDGLNPRMEQNRKIERRQSALAYDHGMYELDGNVLGICDIGTAAESE
jgi:hypothetical protein